MLDEDENGSLPLHLLGRNELLIHLFLNQARYDVTGMADGGVGGGGGMWDDFGGDEREAVPAAERQLGCVAWPQGRGAAIRSSRYSLNSAAAIATNNPTSSAVANNKKNRQSTLHTSLAAASILLSVTVRGNTQKITS